MKTGPPRGADFDICCVDGSRSRISVSTRQGPAIDVCRVDGGRSWISVSILPVARRRRFLVLMVGVPGSPTPAPPRGPTIDVCYIDGGTPKSPSAPPGGLPSTFSNVDGRCSRISSSSTSQRVHRRRFLALVVSAPRSPAPTPPRGAAVDVCNVDGGRSRISSSSTSLGVAIDVS
jgi:hypothetical protein